MGFWQSLAVSEIVFITLNMTLFDKIKQQLFSLISIKMASDLLPSVFANFGCFPKNSFGSGWMDAMKMLKCFELFFNTW